jgi:uncharacterized protein with PQ loop repeat
MLILALFLPTRAFGWQWWIKIDALTLVRLWTLVTPVVVLRGKMFKSVSLEYLPLMFAPLVGWAIYSTTVDGKSITNFLFLDGPIVALTCFGILPFLGFKSKKRNLILSVAFLLEVVSIFLVIKYLPIVAD